MKVSILLATAITISVPGALHAQACGAYLNDQQVQCGGPNCSGSAVIQTPSGPDYQEFYNYGTSCCGFNFPWYGYLASCQVGSLKEGSATLASLERLHDQGVELLVPNCAGELVLFIPSREKKFESDLARIRAQG